MGLAPYGEPKYVEKIYDQLLDIKPDGSFRLNLDYFNFLKGMTMTNGRFHSLFDGPPRKPESPVEQRHMDVARSIQVVTEEVILKLACHAQEITGLKNLCLAGGVALNCVANGRLHREKIFENIWIQPAAGDAGGALGAALAAWRHYLVGQETQTKVGLYSNSKSLKSSEKVQDLMQGALLGPEYSDDEIEQILTKHQAIYEKLNRNALLDRTVELLQAGKVIGWIQGRMEFGPRALGNRSIIGDPRSSTMQSIMNLKVKFRESFRPFAPIVRREKVQEYFDLSVESPYMLLVAPVKKELRLPIQSGLSGMDLLKQVRSTIPAVTHVDYSARIQTIDREQNPLFYALLEKFEKATGCAVLVNTSFNVRGEPIVCSPDDAYRCLVNTEMDYLVMGSYLLDRLAQPHRKLPRTFDSQPD
jgi:carbamoyltransferase